MSSKPRKRTKKQWALFITGLIAVSAGLVIIGFFGVRKLHRELIRQKLMKENVVISIPDLDIEAPVLEGTDNEVLSQAAGHFPDTGDVGSGNYCIAGHSSTLYKEYFNSLKNASPGMEIRLYRVDKTYVTYTVSKIFIVEPSQTDILQDFGDTRVTLVTCTDDGSQRLVVVGKANK